MKNLALNYNQDQTKKPSFTVVEVMRNIHKVNDRNWFKNFMKSILKTSDLDLETFDRIETKRTVYFSKNDFN